MLKVKKIVNLYYKKILFKNCLFFYKQPLNSLSLILGLISKSKPKILFFNNLLKLIYFGLAYYFLENNNKPLNNKSYFLNNLLFKKSFKIIKPQVFGFNDYYLNNNHCRSGFPFSNKIFEFKKEKVKKLRPGHERKALQSGLSFNNQMVEARFKKLQERFTHPNFNIKRNKKANNSGLIQKVENKLVKNKIKFFGKRSKLSSFNKLSWCISSFSLLKRFDTDYWKKKISCNKILKFVKDFKINKNKFFINLEFFLSCWLYFSNSVKGFSNETKLRSRGQLKIENLFSSNQRRPIIVEEKQVNNKKRKINDIILHKRAVPAVISHLFPLFHFKRLIFWFLIFWKKFLFFFSKMFFNTWLYVFYSFNVAVDFNNFDHKFIYDQNYFSLKNFQTKNNVDFGNLFLFNPLLIRSIKWYNINDRIMADKKTFVCYIHPKRHRLTKWEKFQQLNSPLLYYFPMLLKRRERFLKNKMLRHKDLKVTSKKS